MQKYLKKNYLNIILIITITIVPIIFFWYAGYIALAAQAAGFYTNNNLNDLVSITKNALYLFNTFFIEYLIYLIIIFINYILYKTKHPKWLLGINSIVFIFVIVNVIESIINNGAIATFDYFIFLVASIIGFILYFVLKKIKANI